MAKLLSTPTTMWVQTPKPVAQGFASGSDKGSYDPTTSTWTPGKSGGVVNGQSWESVPIGRWVRIAGSELASLTAEVVGAVPAWDVGSLAWNNVMNAWNGFAIDQAGARMWLVAAGGHADSSNNGIYRFDAFRMSWSVERMPSDRSQWSDQYKFLRSPQSGTFTGCFESESQRAAKETAGTLSQVNDWYWDELFWDRRPTSRHVYSSVVYVPGTNELVMGCRRLWRYSLTAGDWTYKRQFPGKVDGAEICCFYDEKTDEFLFGGMGDGIYASHGYKLGTNTWTNWSSPWARFGVADNRHGRIITTFNPPFSNRNNPSYWKYDLDQRQVVANGTAQYTGGLSASDFQSTDAGTSGCSITYIPNLDRYWILYQMNQGMRWLQLNPNTTPWSLSPLVFPDGDPQSADKPSRKVVFIPDLNALVFFSYGDRPGYIYRF